MKTLDLPFSEAIAYVLKEIAADNPAFSIRGGSKSYYTEKVLEEVENKTLAGEHFAQLILGLAIQLAIKEKERDKVIQNARATAQEYLNKFRQINVPDINSKT